LSRSLGRHSAKPNFENQCVELVYVPLQKYSLLADAQRDGS